MRLREDLTDFEYIIWMEKRFGPLQKTIPKNVPIDKVSLLEQELISILVKYKGDLNIRAPIPKVRMWTSVDNKVNFLFFDKRSGKRVLLGKWLANEEEYYEH